MSIERRDFLRTSSLGVAAGLLSPSSVGGAGEAAAAGMLASSVQVPPDWEAVRARFATDRSYVHMSGFYLSSHPTPVADAIREHAGELDANPVLALRTDGEELSRRSMAPYLGADAADLAITTSTTMGLALVIHGLALRPGEEILYTTHDHSVMERSVDAKAELSGASVRRISLYDDARPEEANEAEVLERMRGALRPETRLLAATWVHSRNGVKLPIRAMSSLLEEANATRAPGERVVFLVDGVHGLGVEDHDVPTLGCDFFAAGTHKWMFGPRGTGILWGHPRAQERLTALIPSVSGTSTWGRRLTPGGFQAFEHQWALAAAFTFHRDIGRGRIHQRIHALAAALKEGLDAMSHVRLRTPMHEAMSSGTVCFEVAGMSAAEVEARLLQQDRIIATTTPYTPSFARLAPGLLNDAREVEACLEAVRAMA